MTAAAFLAFLAVMARVVVLLSARYLSRRAAGYLLGGLVVWFTYVTVMGVTGVVRNTQMRPPGIAFLAGPVVVFLLIALVRISASARLAEAIPLWILLGLQCFRVGVELFLHQLWMLGIVPKMLTFAGANVDIYFGISAPLVAWVSTRGRAGLKLSLGWNLLGLLALANVVVRSVLTTPGPFNFLHAEVPDRMIGMFPYLFIPAFFVPLAVMLHVLAIQAIRGRLRIGVTAPVPSGTFPRDFATPTFPGKPVSTQ